MLIESDHTLSQTASHTPGPWAVHEPATGYVQIRGNFDGDAYDDGSPRYISTHVCDVIDNDKDAANARLIAASPRLLAVLELAMIQHYDYWKAEAQAVIAEAKGLAA